MNATKLVASGPGIYMEDKNMLALTRKIGQSIVINQNIVVQVVKVEGNRVVLGVVADKGVKILRAELKEKPRDAA